MRIFSLLLAFCLLACTEPLFADPLSGTVVHGALNFDGDPVDNWFDPANGYGNTTLVTIGSTDHTFSYDDGFNTDTAAFTPTAFTFTDAVHDSSGALAWSMIFTDPAFADLNLVSGDPRFSFTSSGGTLTVNFTGAAQPGTYAASLTPAAVTPEPSSLMLVLSGAIVAIGMVFRRYWQSASTLQKL